MSSFSFTIGILNILEAMPNAHPTHKVQMITKPFLLRNIRGRGRPLIPSSPHLLVLAISERFLPTRGTFRVILVSESHWLQPVLVLSIPWWPTPTCVGRVKVKPFPALKKPSDSYTFGSCLSRNNRWPVKILWQAWTLWVVSRLIFNKVFSRPCPKTLKWKAKKIATRLKTGNF
jgi:hypothetical protein